MYMGWLHFKEQEMTVLLIICIGVGLLVLGAICLLIHTIKKEGLTLDKKFQDRLYRQDQIIERLRIHQAADLHPWVRHEPDVVVELMKVERDMRDMHRRIDLHEGECDILSIRMDELEENIDNLENQWFKLPPKKRISLASCVLPDSGSSTTCGCTPASHTPKQQSSMSVPASAGSI